MEQIKQAIAIIKTRWQEVALVFGLYGMGSFAMALVSQELFVALKSQQSGQSPVLNNHVLVFAIFSVIVMIFSLMLYIGFVRTAHLQGSIEQPAMALLKEGRRFFWRIFGFTMLYSLALVVLQLMVLTAAKGFFHSESLDNIDSGVVKLCAFLVMLLLIKPAILIPALIIVLDCGIIKSLGYLRELKITRSKELIVLFCIQALIILLFSFSDMDKTTRYYILGIFPRTVVYFLRLLIFIIAVRFVSSYNLRVESPIEQMNPDELLNQ